MNAFQSRSTNRHRLVNRNGVVSFGSYVYSSHAYCLLVFKFCSFSVHFLSIIVFTVIIYGFTNEDIVYLVSCVRYIYLESEP